MEQHGLEALLEPYRHAVALDDPGGGERPRARLHLAVELGVREAAVLELEGGLPGVLREHAREHIVDGGHRQVACKETGRDARFRFT
jgi:hypothetical protein